MSTSALTVCGLDLSLTGLGMVAVPEDWGLDFSSVLRRTLETPAGGELVDRIAKLASDVCTWVEWACEGTTPVVSIEGSLTNSPGMADTVRSQLMLAGVVRHELRKRLGIIATTVEQGTARKVLLGKLPTSDRKAAVLAFLQARTAERWRPDEYDAFVVANYRLRGFGFAHIYTEPPPKVKKPRAVRKKAA